MNQRETAARALKAIEAIRGNAVHASKLKTLCMKTPALLQQSGLAQTVVFLRSRETGASIGETYVKHLVSTMGIKGISDTQHLQQRALNEEDLSNYIALTNQAQTAAAWLRRFAQIELADVHEEESIGDGR